MPCVARDRGVDLSPDTAAAQHGPVMYKWLMVHTRDPKPYDDHESKPTGSHGKCHPIVSLEGSWDLVTT